MTKVWLFDLVHYPHGTDPADFDPQLAAKVYEDNLNLYEAADEQGFDGLFLGEHHFTSYTITPSPNLMIAALSQRTKNMRIGLMVNVVPFNHPLRMAEEAAMLDLLTNGRLELGLGRGVDEQEFEKWHMPFQEARPRFEEGIDLMKKAWTEVEFAHEGNYYHVGPLSMWPRPIQKPHPPIWIAAL
jgi:alkanesulfonate monooxygenase SsuD/methylene tetrahydromethanopterin reductase-like flavin-dependent oxidoreductase (luciferase family)